MICLTGDVHQRSYRGTDTPFSPYSEVELAEKYVNIAAGYGIRMTLFFTGKACLEEPRGVKRLAEMPLCEIGGHTFAAFRDPWSRIYRKIYRNPWGSPAHQQRDIVKTINSIQSVIGRRISVWRNHSYINTVDTPKFLETAAIRWVSDEVNPLKQSWEPLSPALNSLPINVRPDHEHLLHGKYQPGKAKPSQLKGRVSIAEWVEQVKTDVQAISAGGGIATILAHPLCMEVADGMVAFEELCRFLQSFPTCWVSEVDA
ncbi:MAG: polysaccharide deacetylase family protein [Nitrospirota bacterium]|nr:polysaccharide deacetylase family protein [Nitrospirota bacterium]